MTNESFANSLLLTEKVAALNDLVSKGNTIEAMEIYYADGVTMQENEEEPRSGKTHCIEHERKILKKMSANTSRLIHQAIDAKAGVVFGEWEHSFTTKDGKILSLTEVSVQHWRDGINSIRKILLQGNEVDRLKTDRVKISTFIQVFI